MIWSSISASGTGKLVAINRIMNTEKKVTSACIENGLIFQHENDPKDP